jgi:hypothetical protein
MEKNHDNLLRVSRFGGSIHRLNQISKWWIRIRTNRTINKIIDKELFILKNDASDNISLRLKTKNMLS